MNKCEVVTTYHKACCNAYLTICKCSEKNGLFIKETFFKNNGKKEGNYVSYYYNGQILVECSYINNLIQGYYKIYYYNGNIALKCFYKDDKRDGEFINYDSNGNVLNKGNFSN